MFPLSEKRRVRNLCSDTSHSKCVIICKCLSVPHIAILTIRAARWGIIGIIGIRVCYVSVVFWSCSVPQSIVSAFAFFVPLRFLNTWVGSFPRSRISPVKLVIIQIRPKLMRREGIVHKRLCFRYLEEEPILDEVYTVMYLLWRRKKLTLRMLTAYVTWSLCRTPSLNCSRVIAIRFELLRFTKCKSWRSIQLELLKVLICRFIAVSCPFVENRLPTRMHNHLLWLYLLFLYLLFLFCTEYLPCFIAS